MYNKILLLFGAKFEKILMQIRSWCDFIDDDKNKKFFSFFFVFNDYSLILEDEMLLFYITGSHFLLEEYN